MVTITNIKLIGIKMKELGMKINIQTMESFKKQSIARGIKYKIMKNKKGVITSFDTEEVTYPVVQ